MRRHGHEVHHEGEGPGELSSSLLFHAIIMTVWTLGIAPWAYVSARSGNRLLHISGMTVLSGLFIGGCVHAVAEVEAPGPHSHAHGYVGLLAAAAVAVQFGAGVFRNSSAVFRALHVFLGRLAAGVLFPTAWVLGLGAACSDTSTAFIGHWSVSIFTAALGVAGKVPVRAESATMAAGGAIGLLGDLAVTPDPLGAHQRVQHLYLYGTFIVAGLLGLATGSRLPGTGGIATMGVLMVAHQHGHGRLTMAVHATSGLLLLVAAAARLRDAWGVHSGALVAFSVVFLLSQPELCACWTARTELPAIYYTAVLQVAALAVWAVSVKKTPFPATVTKLSIDDNDDEGSV